MNSTNDELCSRELANGTRRMAVTRRLTRAFHLLLLVVVLTGCATEYQRKSFTGGYSETQLGENIFQVTFVANGYTSRERASDFSLLRSAEVAREHGFRYFVIVGAEKDSNVSIHTTPLTSYTTASGTTTTYGGQTYFISKPQATNTVLYFKEKPDVNGILFDAEFVIKSISTKYKLNE
jgi:hypothetical protein